MSAAGTDERLAAACARAAEAIARDIVGDGEREVTVLARESVAKEYIAIIQREIAPLFVEVGRSVHALIPWVESFRLQPNVSEKLYDLIGEQLDAARKAVAQ